MSFCASACICDDLHKYIPEIDHNTFTIIKEITGGLASFSSAIMFIPNMIDTCKTCGKKTIPLNFMFLYIVQCSFWLLYGILIFSIPTILLELFLISNVFFMFFFRIYYLRKKKKERMKSETRELEIQQLEDVR